MQSISSIYAALVLAATAAQEPNDAKRLVAEAEPADPFVLIDPIPNPGKSAVELPIEESLAGFEVVEGTPYLFDTPDLDFLRADLAKGFIELRIEELIASPAHLDLPTPDQPVQPGLVPWHESFEAACAAASESGKPVMLFQLMGRLDDEFC